MAARVVGLVRRRERKFHTESKKEGKKQSREDRKKEDFRTLQGDTFRRMDARAAEKWA